MSLEDTWQLKIPIRLSLSSSEISSPADVKPVYLLAPRHAYLSALAEQCLKYFQHVLLSLPGQAAVTPWFEYQGLPLNWVQPLGVLYDLLCATSLSAASGQQQQQPELALTAGSASPWCLTVHYRNMPASLHNTWQNAGAAKEHYFTSLKEAGYCCRGSEGSGAVMKLPGQTHDDLWAAVNRGDGAAVRHIMAPLRLEPTPKQGGTTASVPVRLYIRRHKTGHNTEDVSSLWEQVYSTSRPIDAHQPDGSPTLLAHVMHLVMPQQFSTPVLPAATHQQQQQLQQPQQGLIAAPADSVDQPAEGATTSNTQDTGDPLGTAGGQPAAEGVAGGQRSAPESGIGQEGAAPADMSIRTPNTVPPAAAIPTPSEVGGIKQAAQGSGSDKEALAAHVLPEGWPAAVVLVCGVQPDWCTPLAWLHANLRTADCFLHIVVHLLA